VSLCFVERWSELPRVSGYWRPTMQPSASSGPCVSSMSGIGVASSTTRSLRRISPTSTERDSTIRHAYCDGLGVAAAPGDLLDIAPPYVASFRLAKRGGAYAIGVRNGRAELRAVPVADLSMRSRSRTQN
jgi:hypothetical protein